MTNWMLESEKILITGATGKIAFPIARALAERNEVWGVARLRDPADRERLAGVGVTPVALDIKPAISLLCPTISRVYSTLPST
jgi:UDP-glucuronate 4-epimerase